MARKPRIHYSGAVYHVMLRGNAGQAIFFTDEDRSHLYRLIDEGVERFGHRGHAFCLMDNHIHLAVQVADSPLSKSMQNLAFRYARWINRRKGRMGHLFQGRYKAVLVDANSYLLELCRYIHLNPVRAKLVKKPEAYPWSGHRAYLGKEKLPWLTTEWVLSQFSERLGTARLRYAGFVDEGTEEGRRDEFHRGIYEGHLLGDDRFIARVHRKLGRKIEHAPSLKEIVAVVCKETRVREDGLLAPGKQRQAARTRVLVGLLATEFGSATLTEVSRYLGRDPATLSNGFRTMKERMTKEKDLKRSVDGIREKLIKIKKSKA